MHSSYETPKTIETGSIEVARMPYAPPGVTVVGSVKDLTQALQLTLNPDNLTGLPILGPPIS